MAAALINQRVSSKELDDDFVRRQDVTATMQKVRITTTDEKMADMPFAPDDRVSVVLNDGKTLVHEPVARPKGSWQRPLSDGELREKFLDCAAADLPDGQASILFDRLRTMDGLTTLRELPLVRI